MGFSRDISTSVAKICFLLVCTIPASLCREQKTHRGPQENPKVACFAHSGVLQRGFDTFAMLASLCILQ